MSKYAKCYLCNSKCYVSHFSELPNGVLPTSNNSNAKLKSSKKFKHTPKDKQESTVNTTCQPLPNVDDKKEVPPSLDEEDEYVTLAE